MCPKGFVTAAFGSSGILENGRVLSAPSLHRESTDSLIHIHVNKSPVGSKLKVKVMKNLIYGFQWG